MGLAPTNFNNQVTWEGMTWTFQSPVTWGYFINGQPFVVAPVGQSVNLISVEPGPQFIPYQQIRGKTGAGLPTVRMIDAYGYTLTGSTTANYGVMWNLPGNTHGMFINGQLLNAFSMKANGLTGITGIIEGANESAAVSSPSFKTLDTTRPKLPIPIDTRFQNFNASAVNTTNPTSYGAGEVSKAFNSWISSNLSSNPKPLTAGDILLSYDTPYYEDAVFASNGVQIPTIASGYPFTTAVRKTGVLSIVSSVPDANEFRPPVFWDSAYNGPRPTGFTLGNVSGKTAAFLSLPTKGLDGRTFGIAFDPNNGYTSGNTMSIGLMSADSRTRNLFKYPIPPFSSLLIGPISENATNSTEGAISRGTHGLLNFWGGETYNEPGSVTAAIIGSNIGLFTAEYFSYMHNNMPIFTAMSIFADWHSESDRKNSLIRTIQYAIDLYGMIKCNIPLIRYAVSGATINSTRTSLVCQRGLIILVGWLLNNQEMMNIDSVNEQQGLTWFNWATNSPREFGLNFPSITKMNSALLFPEGNVRRLAGTYGDPSVANIKALAYTDPGTTHNLGLGWNLKYTTNPLDLSYGMTFASAGTTYNPTTTYFVYRNQLATGQTHAQCYFTMYSGKQVAFTYAAGAAQTPGATSGQISFPKWRQVSGPQGTDHIFPNSIGKNKVIGCRLKIVSGPGSGSTEYTIIDTHETAFGPPVNSVIAYNNAAIISNNTAVWSGIAKLGFILDKDWQNGVPDSTSRAIIYPFSSSDIGKCVSSLTSIDELSLKNNTNNENPHYDRSAIRGGDLARTLIPGYQGSADLNYHSEQTLAYLAFLYGLLYQIGKRYPSSQILDNQITLDAMDYLLETMFGSEPHGPYLSIAGDSFDPSTSMALTVNASTHPISIVYSSSKIGMQNYYGGLLRQLWEREVPRSRT